MKHLKMFSLLVIAAISLIALPVDTASAGPNFCTVQESPCPEGNRWAAGTELDLSLASGKSSLLTDTVGEELDKCTGSTAKGKIESAEPVTGKLESLTWSKCTFETTTTLLGKIEVAHIAGSHNGTVKGDSETKVTISTIFFGSCVYGPTAGVSLGELKEGKPAIFVANAVLKKLTGSNFACPETAKWTAEYTLTEPSEKTLSVETGMTPSPGPNFCTVQESPCPEGNRWAAGTELNFSIKSGASSLLVNTEGETLDTCTSSTAKGKLESAEPVTGPIESLTWSSCTFETKTLKLGKLEVAHIAGSHNGTVKADSITEVTIKTVLFGSCIYGVEAGKSLGDLTEGKPAVFHANAVATRQSGSSIVCPGTALWTGTFTLTEPSEKTLSVETG